MPTILSESETTFIQAAIKVHNLRLDGRSTKEFRPISITTGVMPQANGSARVQVGNNNILVGCKLETIDLNAENVNSGRVECHVEATPSAVEVMPESLTIHLLNHLTSLFAYLSLCPQLLILPQRKAWKLTLDTIILSADGGNLFDIVTLAVRVALEDLKIPKVKPVGYVPSASVNNEGEGSQGIDSLLKSANNKSKNLQFELESYWDEGEPLEEKDKLPLSVTLNLLNQTPFYDADSQEEVCTSSKLIISFTRNGNLCGLEQIGEGEIEWDKVQGLIQEAATIAKELHRTVEKHFQSQSRVKR